MFDPEAEISAGCLGGKISATIAESNITTVQFITGVLYN